MEVLAVSLPKTALKVDLITVINRLVYLSLAAAMPEVNARSMAKTEQPAFKGYDGTFTKFG